MSARDIAPLIPRELLALTSNRLERDVRERFHVDANVAFKAVAIARERAE